MMGLYRIHRENKIYIEDYLVKAVTRKGWLDKEVRGFYFTITYDISVEDYIVKVFHNSSDVRFSKLDRSFLSKCINEHFLECEPVYYKVRHDDPDLEIV